MIDTSKDLLYVVLAFSILWLTVFISWMLYYVIMTLRQINQLVTSFKEKVDKVSRVMEKIKEKFEGSSVRFGIINKVLEKLFDLAAAKKKKGKG